MASRPIHERGYAHPEALVSTDWVAEHLQDPDVRVVESDEDVLEHIGHGGQLVDVRSPEEFSGEKLHMPDYPQEGAMRGGHIPGAKSMPWARAVNPDTGEFRSAEELRALYQ